MKQFAFSLYKYTLLLPHNPSSPPPIPLTPNIKTHSSNFLTNRISFHFLLLFVTILRLLISSSGVVTYKKMGRLVWLLIKNLKRSGWSERYKEEKEFRHKILRGLEKEKWVEKQKVPLRLSSSHFIQRSVSRTKYSSVVTIQ